MKKLHFTAPLFALFGLGRLQAQMTTSSYLIRNLQNCDITVAYRVTDCSTGLCNNSSLVITAGSSFLVPCGSPDYDINVAVTEMNYIPVGGGCYSGTPGGCLGLPSSNTLPLSTTLQAGLGSCASPTGNCVITSSGSQTRVTY